MCTSIVSNRGKTLVGWNLDILDMEYRITVLKERVSIDIYDDGRWLPLFGSNSRGEFINMPTCWPYDSRSDPAGPDCRTVPQTNSDLLLGNTTIGEVRRYLGEGGGYTASPASPTRPSIPTGRGTCCKSSPARGTHGRSAPLFRSSPTFPPSRGTGNSTPGWAGTGIKGRRRCWKRQGSGWTLPAASGY